MFDRKGLKGNGYVIYVGQKQLYVFLSNMFNFSYQRVDIVFTKNDIHTLIDVVIVNSTQANLFPQYCVT